MAQRIEGISHLDSQELRELLRQPDRSAIVIDVREPEEYEASHIPGIPLIPMGDIIDKLEEMDTAKEYIFVCRSGRRSFEVAKYFLSNGFEHVHNHLGGMLDWQSSALEIAVGPEEGAPLSAETK
jgi:rhodanese-related sulfurtransferase